MNEVDTCKEERENRREEKIKNFGKWTHFYI
jgi:hypothetical protein